jgi:hypothetical protein
VPPGYLTLAGAQIVSGTTVTAAGRVATIAGRPLPGRQVSLQTLSQAAGGGSSETTIAQTSSDPDGHFTLPVQVTANVLLRAIVGRAPASTSPLVWIAVATAITLELPPYALQTKGAVHVSGTVSPHKRHVTIFAYRRGHEQPAKEVTVRVHRGHYRARLKLRPGRYVLRARTTADAHNLAGSSRRLRITVR